MSCVFRVFLYLARLLQVRQNDQMLINGNRFKLSVTKFANQEYILANESFSWYTFNFILLDLCRHTAGVLLLKGFHCEVKGQELLKIKMIASYCKLWMSFRFTNTCKIGWARVHLKHQLFTIGFTRNGKRNAEKLIGFQSHSILKFYNFILARI